MRNRITAYLLVFDRQQSDRTYLELNKFIKESDDISKWWHYLSASYIFVSEESVTKLRDQFRRLLKDDSFLLIEVNLDNCDGWLPSKAWEWIYRNTEQLEPAE